MAAAVAGPHPPPSDAVIIRRILSVLAVVADPVVVAGLPLELGLHQPLLAAPVVARPQQRRRRVVHGRSRQAVATVDVLDSLFLQLNKKFTLA